MEVVKVVECIVKAVEVVEMVEVEVEISVGVTAVA